MSRYTFLTYSREYCGDVFFTLMDVERAIDENEKVQNNCKQQLLSYALMTEPNKMLDLEDGLGAIDVIPSTIETILDTLEEATNKLSFLYDLKEHWDACHNNGAPIERKEDEFYKKAYLNLDY